MSIFKLGFGSFRVSFDRRYCFLLLSLVYDVFAMLTRLITWTVCAAQYVPPDAHARAPKTRIREGDEEGGDADDPNVDNNSGGCPCRVV